MDSESFRVAVFEQGLPISMPGETVLQESNPYGAYDPEGNLLSTDARVAVALMANWDKRKHHHFETSLSYDGKDFWVSTVWLGMNHANFGGPPLIWETMAQSNGWLNFQARYSTTAAARHGHLTIISVLLSGGMKLIESSIDIPGHQVHTIEGDPGAA